MPVVEERHELPESERACLVCRGPLEPMGEQSEDSEEITVVKRQFVLVRHKRQKYRCRCNSAVETAPGPRKLIPGGRYSVEFAVEVALQKYAYHLPLERQVKMMRHEGLLCDSQTLWDQLEALGRVLLPTYQRIHGLILAADVVHVDETRWMLLQKGGSKQWNAWAFSTEEAVYYHIDPTRSATVPAEILKDYCGVLVTDGYAAYQTVANERPGLLLSHCMAHARRKFVEALPSYPQCQTAIDIIRELYLVEADLPMLRGLDGEPRQQALLLRARERKEKSEPLMEQLRLFAQAQSALPQSLLHKAVFYLLSHWQGLTRFLGDARIPIDNNVAERDLRGVAVGRKNHYGSKSLRGTQVAALFYSLVETASRYGADPRAYLLAAAQRALNTPGSTLLPADLQ